MKTSMSKLRRCAAASLLLTLIAVPADAQVLYGSVIGSLEDQSGASVPNATATLTSQSTGQTLETTADQSGTYRFVNVLPGRYDLRVTAQGFRTVTRPDVDVTANSVTRADFRMEVGALAEEVTITAEAALLQTDQAATQSNITTKVVETLPLNAYRNYQALINLVPGASPSSFQNSATDTPGGALRSFVNGTPTNMNTTRLDGAINVNIWLPHHTMYTAPSETVQEVNVSTTAMDAEQGMAGGAAITVITKSGTNEFHGSAWEYHNNQHLRSRGYFQPATQEKPRDTLNIFGGTLGGPIVKNRLFFFGHFEGTRQRTGGSNVYDVPTAKVRSGDFSGLATIYDPMTGDASGRGRTPFANNQIPTERISPIARAILDALPLPNIPGRETQNYAFAGTAQFDRNNYDYKINWSRNEKHQIWGKSSFLVADVTGVPIFGELVGPAVIQDPGTGHTFTQIHGIGHTYTITPNVLFDQNFGFTRQTQNVLGLDYGTNWGSDVFGIPGTNGPDERQSGMPAFEFGYANVGQLATWMPLFRKEQSFTLSNNLSWIKGSHDLRFGFDMIHHQLNHWQPEIQNPRGRFIFNQSQTALNGTRPDGTLAPNFYNRFAAFLLDRPSQIDKSLQYLEMTGREWQLGFYIRDRWQVNRRLTLNLGLRYEYYPLMTRADSGIERLDPQTQLVYLGGYGDVPKNAGISVSSKLFAPRIGFALRLTDKTVLRSGYGLNYDPLPFSRPLRGFYPLTIAGNWVGGNDFVPAGSMGTGVPEILTPDLSSGVIPLPTTVDMRSPWSEINRGYIQSWNFTLERELPANFVATAAYVGTKMTHQLGDRNINVGPPGITAANLPYAQAFGRRIAINMWDGWMDSNYHSLQTTLDKRFSNGLLLKGSYTWAKAINMTDENGWVSVNWNWDPAVHRNRAPAGYDRTHVFQMGYVYELPFGKGKKWASSGPASWIVGNWSASGVFYAFTGSPFSVTSNVALNSPGNLQTADQVKDDVEVSGNVGPGQKWFDVTAFAEPQQNQFGTSGRNTMRGPGRIGTDISLARIFPIGERFRFEFRAEAFNLTNTPWFSNPNANRSNANFGEITSTVTQSGREISPRQFRFGGVIRF
jgi:outer membrane receptor protein involved in Fe transport